MLKSDARLKRINILKMRRIIFIVVVFCIAFLGFYQIVKSLMGTKNNQDIKYIYNASNDIDYKVYMYDNSFFYEDYLESGKQYTADLIRNIAVDYKAIFTNSKFSNLSYSYKVGAEINAYNKNNKEAGVLWNKKYDIKTIESTSVSNITNHIVRETIDVDYEFYNEEAKNFKKELNIDIEAYLNLEFIIDVEFEVDGEVHKESQNAKLSIPLIKSTFEIEKNISTLKSNTVLLDSKVNVDYIRLVIGLLLVILTLPLVIWFFKELLRINKKTLYAKKLNKILKVYGDIIVETSNLPDYYNLDILEIANFKDLVDIEYETRNPIMYYERKADKEGWFVIIKEKYMYRYMLFDNSSTDN